MTANPSDADDITALRGERGAASDESAARELRGSSFQAFAEEGFRPTEAWEQLRTILASNGGSYGLLGPRGAGKSWLMQRSVLEAQRSGGMGLWFPSPSEEAAQPFLSSLSDNFANEVERRFGRRGAREILSGTRGRLFWTAMGVVVFSLMFYKFGWTTISTL